MFREARSQKNFRSNTKKMSRGGVPQAREALADKTKPPGGARRFAEFKCCVSYGRERPVPASQCGLASNAACMIQPPMNGRTQSAAMPSTSLDRSSRRSLALTSRPARIGLKAMQPTVVMPYHFSALGAGEVGAVMEVVAADLRPVDRRHAEADNELAGEHVRAALGQDEGVGLGALGDQTAEHSHGHCQAKKYFPHSSPQSLESRASEGRAVPFSVRCARNTRRGTDLHASRAWLTVQMVKRVSAQIWPHLWRNRHKFGQGCGKHLGKLRSPRRTSHAAETIMKRDQIFGVESTGT